LSYPAAFGPLGEGSGDAGLAALPRVRAKNALGGRTFNHIRSQPEGSGTGRSNDQRIAPIFAGNDQGRASRIILNGVSAARRNLVNPASVTTCLKRRSPAWAPNPNATS